MSKRKQAPTLKRHKATGHAYSRFSGRQIWFGRYDDRDAHLRFATFLARWEANERKLPEEEAATPLTVADLIALYLEHAEVYYRKPDGTTTHEVVNVRYTVKPLIELFAKLGVADFNLRCLKQYRESLIDGGLQRSTVNNRVTRVVRIFGWGAEEELVPPEVYGGLKALRALKRNRSRAPEGTPVEAVAWDQVEPVLELVSRQVAAMILLQWHSGMRPGEALLFRLADVDRTGPVWIYSPRRHKTEHHGRQRTVALGPRAQDVLRLFLAHVPAADPELPLFSPRDAVAERRARARSARKTPIWPSQERARASRKKRLPKKQAGSCYTRHSYRRAIVTACEALGFDRWSPNQLRHAAASRIRRERGLEVTRAVLGHASAAVTEVYADIDDRVAIDVMSELG